MRRSRRARIPRKMFRRVILLGGGALWCAALAMPAAAQEITRVSVNSDGVAANSDSFFAAISADGRVVAFKSDATNLTTPLADNTQFDIYVHDLDTGVTERVSQSTLPCAGDNTCVGNNSSFPATISGDGQLVAFGSAATNLLGPGNDTNGSSDVFVRNRADDTTTRVSVTNSGVGVPGNTREIPPSMSTDGRWVAFETAAKLTADDPHTGPIADAYVFDRDTNIVQLVSKRLVTMDPEPAFAPGISGDGCVVAFVSSSRQLVPQGQDTDEHLDVYARDLCADPPFTERISVNAAGTSSNSADSQGSLFPPSLNADGSLVAFESAVSNLVPGDTNGTTDVFVRDRAAGTTERISVNTFGTGGNGASTSPSISADGRWVVFASNATNLLPNLSTNTGGRSNIYVRDRASNQTCRVSMATVLTQANGDSVNPVISRDGHWIAFESTASDLVPNDVGGNRDIFVVENRADLQDCPPTPTPTDTATAAPSSTPTITATAVATETPTSLPTETATVRTATATAASTSTVTPQAGSVTPTATSGSPDTPTRTPSQMPTQTLVPPTATAPSMPSPTRTAAATPSGTRTPMSCTTSGDCSSGRVCDPISHTCVMATPSPSPSPSPVHTSAVIGGGGGGCSIGAAASRGDGAGQTLMLLLPLLGLVLRRRSRSPIE